MKNDDFLKIIRSYTARVAVGPSAVRGNGNAGVVATASRYLREMDLAPFGTRSLKQFNAALDANTESLRRRLPPKAQHWGLARKVMNIYLRGALYTGYLRDAYRLDAAEHFFEVPLDRYTAKAICRARGTQSIRWDAVKRLTPELSALFQDIAAREAKRRDIARIHLDAVWWSADRDVSS